MCTHTHAAFPTCEVEESSGSSYLGRRLSSRYFSIDGHEVHADTSATRRRPTRINYSSRASNLHVPEGITCTCTCTHTCITVQITGKVTREFVGAHTRVLTFTYLPAFYLRVAGVIKFWAPHGYAPPPPPAPFHWDIGAPFGNLGPPLALTGLPCQK